MRLRFRPREWLALAAVALAWSCGGGDVTPLKPGEFDRSFGTNGIATLEDGPFAGAGASARFAAADPATGTIRATGNVLRSSVHAHLLPGGAPDAGFAGTGFALLPAEPTNLPFAIGRDGVAVLARADGTEVLVESVHVPCVTGPQCAISGGGYWSTAARATSSTGVAVPGYGLSGEAVLALVEPTQALVEPSGAVLVLGRASAGPAGIRRNALVRLTPQGRPDEAFADRTAASVDCPGFDPLRSFGAVMARHADGKLLLAQSFATGGTPEVAVCVSRLLPDGMLDASHGTGGRAMLPWPFQWDRATPVAMFALPGGGSALFLQTRRELNGNFHYHYMIATMTADGSLDAGRFDGGTTGPTDLHVAKLAAVAMQSDGRYLVAGYPALGDNLPAPPGAPTERIDPSQPRIGRLLVAGGADLSFGPLGTGYTPLLSFGKRLVPRHVSIGPDRGIFVAGSLGDAGPVNDNELTKFGVAKLTGDAAAAP